MTRVAGRTALITGGGSGIGRLLAAELAVRGARIVLWDVSEEGMAATAELIASRDGGDVHPYTVDLTDRGAVAEVGDRVLEDVGAVDIVVNNAGIVSGARFLDLPPDKVERTFAVNTLALYWVTRAFLPAMLERGTGHIVTIASAAGLVGVSKQTDYSASKHAAVGFTESLRAELRAHAPGVKTTTVMPYYIDTGMFDGVRTRWSFLLPILDQHDVSRRIADAIESDRAELALPPVVKLLPALRVLPTAAFDAIMDTLGVNRTMEEFVGRDVR